jgi:putative ABC transport system permease protein
MLLFDAIATFIHQQGKEAVALKSVASMPKNPLTFRRRTPVAWSQLTHRKIRLAVALSGIAFANVLIFMQLGFRALFTTGATALPENLAGELFMVPTDARFISSMGFDRIRLIQAAAVEGVEQVTPLYVNGGAWAYSKDYLSFDTRVFAFNLQQPVFDNPALLQLMPKLREPDTILFDELSRDDLGPVAKVFQSGKPVQAILNNQRLNVVGLFKMGNSFFVGEGNILTSEANYQALFGAKALEKVSVGIIWVRSETDIRQVQADLGARIPGIKILTKAELLEREVQFQSSSPAGPIFSFGAVMGFIIGIVIVYQVLYADINDHLAEYATLKAMGYSNVSVMMIIFQEAVLLAVMGFVPGLLSAHLMYGLLANITKLGLAMRPDVAAIVFCLTMVMCLSSALIASNKLRSADPADIFD